MAPTIPTIHAIAVRADTHEQPTIFHQRRLTAVHTRLNHQTHPKRGEQE